MGRVCTNCGTEAAEGDRFCSACGTALETGEGAERKLATMVFVDLVGSTEIAAGSDPEDLRGRLEPFFETARASLREHGGTIEKRAEAFVLTNDPRADEALAEAADRIGEYLFAQGILMRAQGLAGRDDALLRESLALFEKIESPYQAARSGWLLGGEAKEAAGRAFERLGATLRAD